MALFISVHAESPETMVADRLRTVGDRVNEEICDVLSAAVAAVLPAQAAVDDIPYVTLQSAAEGVIGHVHPGWSQVPITVCSCCISFIRKTAVALVVVACFKVC